MWNLHPQPWRHFECRTSGDCAIKIHSADRNCNNRGKMSSVYFFHSPVTLSPRNTGKYVVHTPIALLSYNDKGSQLLLEENRRGEEVFWHMCQVRSLEASITLWQWQDAFYITLKSTRTAVQGYVCVSEATPFGGLALWDQRRDGCSCRKTVSLQIPQGWGRVGWIWDTRVTT